MLADVMFEWDRIDSVAKTTITTIVNYKFLQLLTQGETSNETWSLRVARVANARTNTQSIVSAWYMIHKSLKSTQSPKV